MAPDASPPTTAARFVAAGAGRMGRGIAIACAWAGHRVALVDLRERDAAGRSRFAGEVESDLRANLAALASLGVLDENSAAALRARIALVDAAGAAEALAAAEIVFEGVPETMDAKREALAVIAQHAAPDAVIASTTSSILVTDLAPLVERPARFLNAHWLNPAFLVPVVELSVHPGTAREALARSRTLLEALGKVPVTCGPTPGYIVPRLQALVMNEAARMIEEGAATAEEIDTATRYGLGLRFAALGVVEFIDFGGIDILHHASREMSASIDPARYRAPAIVGRMVEAGHLGFKTGSGFLDHAARDPAAYRRDVLARMLAQVQHAGLWRPAAAATLS